TSIKLDNRNTLPFATAQAISRIRDENSETDVHRIVLDFGDQPFPVLEGQSIGIIPPGNDEKGEPHQIRLYSIASPRHGERPNSNNLSLTLKREGKGDRKSTRLNSSHV